MIFIHGLDLRNVVVFDDVSVDFTPGVINVRGINLDSDPAEPTGNAVGKTLLFSAIPNLRYQATHLSRRKKSRRDLLGRRGSQIGAIIQQHKDGPEYEVVQTPSKYLIYEDGKDLEVRGLAAQEKYLDEIFPIQPDDFYAYSFVSTQRPYAIQTETDANRLQLFANLFRLDQFDELKDYFAKKSRDISDNEVRMGTLEQQRQEFKRNIKKLQQPVSKEEYSVVCSSVEDYKKQNDDIRSRLAAMNFRRSGLTSLLSIEQELDKLRSKYKHATPPESVLSWLKVWREAARDWDRYKHASSIAKRQEQKLNEKLATLKKPEGSLSELRAEKKKLESDQYVLEEKLREFKALAQEYGQWQRSLDTARSEFDQFEIDRNKVDLAADYTDEEAQCRVNLRLKRLLDHGHDGAECPTCLSPVDLEAIRDTVKSAEKKLERIARLTRAQQSLQKLIRLEEKKPKKPIGDKESIQADLDSVVKRAQRLAAKIDQFKEYQHISAQLADIDRPKKPGLKKPDLSGDQIEAEIDLCHAILKHLESKKRLVAEHDLDMRSAAKVERAIKDVDSAFALLDEKRLADDRRAAKQLQKIADYRAFENSKTLYEKGLSEVDKKIEKLQSGFARKKIVTILQKAYSNKGLKALAVDGICRLYQSNLNHYKDLAFLEPFEFSVEASESGVSIMVDRNNGKKDSVSDVRHLSGAESDSFRLLSVIALITLVPDSRRLNLLILDEPTSHMDERYKILFKERIVPVLREIVPTLVIISPHDSDLCDGSRIWTVIKQNGVSTLEIN